MKGQQATSIQWGDLLQRSSPKPPFFVVVVVVFLLPLPQPGALQDQNDAAGVGKRGTKSVLCFVDAKLLILPACHHHTEQ